MSAGFAPEVVSALVEPVVARLGRSGRVPLVLGLCGAQGSGKTTLTHQLLESFARRGIAAAALSIDDLYLTRAEREVLARDVHPLLATRGPPGTHDVALGLALFAALGRGEDARIPRFDKARDDRRAQECWDAAPPACRVLVFEGWCVGAQPQAEAELHEPVNALERDEDPQGIWRRTVNDALAGAYQRLFGRIDFLVLLAAPGFDVVFDWRMQQEAQLRARAGADAPFVMDAAAVARFIAHYERLTRHILAEMPARADCVIGLARDRTVLSIASR